MNRLLKLPKIVLLLTISFFLAVSFISYSYAADDDGDGCANECEPDCNQAAVSGCNTSNPSESQCRSNASCSQTIWDWACCAGGTPDPDPIINNPRGTHDESSCSGVRGWACDPDNYAASLQVDFWLETGNNPGLSSNVYLGGAIANGAASNPTDAAGIASQCGGYSSHRFTWNINNSLYNLRDGVPHNISAYAINIGSTGSNQLLSGSPKSLTCTSVPVAPAAPTLESPANNATGQGSTSTLQARVSNWGVCNGGSGTINYRRTGNYPGNTCPATSAANYPDLATSTPTSLVDNASKTVTRPNAQSSRYCWYAQANNGCLTSANSAPWAYSTCTPNSPLVNLGTPADSATVTGSSTTLSWGVNYGIGCWSNVNSVTVYRATKTAVTCNLQTGFAVAPGCAGIPSTNTSCVTTGLTNLTNYCWYVNANNGSINADSARREFRACVPSVPTLPTQVSPANDTGITTSTPSYTWTAPAGWGQSCPSGNQVYRVYTAPKVGASCAVPNAANFSPYTLQTTSNVSGTAFTQTTALTANTNYCWFVSASNNDFAAGSYSVPTSAAQIFTFRTPVTVTGRVWDATGGTCALGASAIPEGSTPDRTDLTSGYTANTYQGDINNPALYGTSDARYYEVRNVPTHPSLAHPSTIRGVNIDSTNPLFTYRLSCIDSSFASAQSTSASSVNLSDIKSSSYNQNVNLGYRLVAREGWFLSVLGDVFSNCTSCGADGIFVALPVTSPMDGTPYLIDNNALLTNSSHGLAIAKRGIQALTPPPSSATRISGGNSSGAVTYDNYQVSGYETAAIQPNKFPFPNVIDFDNPPTNTIAVPSTDPSVSCSDFWTKEGSRVYEMSPACFNSVSGTKTYDWSGGGTVVIYITGDLTIDSNIVTASNSRLTLVVDGSVTFSPTYPSSDPVLSYSSTPNIEAMIIAENDISFPTAGAEADTTVTIEGSLISKAGVDFDRNKGVNNNLPAEMIRFQPRDFIHLNRMELNASSVNYTGLFVNDITWTTE